MVVLKCVNDNEKRIRKRCELLLLTATMPLMKARPEKATAGRVCPCADYL